MHAASTHCTFKVMQRELLEYLLLLLIVFPLNVNVASFEKNASFRILFLSSTEPIIHKFSTLQFFSCSIYSAG
jgi:hypothetical protein